MALSPMMSFYLSLKEEYKDSIVMFRLGDFYEMFFDDAKEASEILDLTLTGRACGLEERAPMCGIPFHALDNYLPKLIKAGKKVAICEQLNTPEDTQGKMVDRGVVRVITPGTVIEENILNEGKNNYLACVAAEDNLFAISWIDISTGEFNTLQSYFKSEKEIEDLLMSIHPAEVICNSKIYDLLKDSTNVKMGKLPSYQRYVESLFDKNKASEILKKQFKVYSLQLFEIDDKPLSIATAGALMNYVLETQKRDLCHILSIKYVKNNDYLIIDSTARKNLELTESIRDGSKKATLLGVLDNTKTSMGARNIRKWIEKPLINSKEINQRLDAVEELVNNAKVRSNLAEVLSNIKDLERLAGRVSYGNPTPRDFLAISSSLQYLPAIKQLLGMCNSALITSLNDKIDNLSDLYQLLSSAIDEDCSALIRDGGFIKKGFNQELDDLKNSKALGKQWLAELEAREKEETGIKTLKVGYNKVFGYYIEVSKGQIENVPLRYIRKQTLTTGERYITEELKQIEEKLLGSDERSIELEIELFNQIKGIVLSKIPQILSTSSAISIIDTLLSFAIVSLKNNYVKPVINNTVDSINIIDGRHPVVESILKSSSYVPNDTLLDNCSNRTMIITGPNMSGKSTYMRQVALITIMAHMGCFVPAKKAEIAITDRVFTRIGASDDLAFGQSTFMVEMIEVATIIQNATYRSLLILDEIGRGTSTYDGLAIARAVIEDISQRIKCRTLFSTHFHELTELASLLNGLKNYKVLACEKNKQIVFLHKIMEGGTNKSFGVEVAKLAGIPLTVIKRAKEIQKILERISVSTQSKEQNDETNLLDIAKENSIKQELLKLDIDSMTPVQSFMKLQELIEMAKREN